MSIHSTKRRLTRLENTQILTDADKASDAMKRMQLRWALLSDDQSTRAAAHRALGDNPEQSERDDLETIRQDGIASHGCVTSDFVHFFRLRERLLAQHGNQRNHKETLDQWRQSMYAACELPADVPLDSVRDALEIEPDYAEFSGLVSDVHKHRLPPVDPFTFVETPQLLNKGGIVWAAVMEALVELNSGKYSEAVLTGGIGCGKTTLALYTLAFQLYLLSLMQDPHGEYGLDPSSDILMIFQSITANAARSVDYHRFRSMIASSPYFSREYPCDRNIESEMRFPRGIVVRPVSGECTAAIGENVIGGVIDEMNYMEVVDRSRRAVGIDGTYDQAIEGYQAIARRRKSRFMRHGELPGVLCLVSSRRYPGQFTDMKQQEAKTDPTIYVYDKREWEVRPEDTYSGKMFRVFVGNGTRNPRIIGDDEILPRGAGDCVMEVPVEYRKDFENDLMASLRDIAGLSAYARHPFIMDVEALDACFGRVESVLSAESVDFETVGLKVYSGRIMFPDRPRFAHVDLARSSDSAAVAVAHVNKFVKVERGEDVGFEILPLIVLDLVLEVRPPPAGEINFAKIRALFYKLFELDMNLRWITYDSYQSTDSLQILSQHGFSTGELSVDRTTKPYDVLKQAITDRRLLVPEHAKAQEELLRLEYDARKGKIDHPVRGSKDCADAIAGAVFGLVMRTDVWLDHDIPPYDVPASVIEAVDVHNRSGREWDERR